jgi:hypothetical protein
MPLVTDGCLPSVGNNAVPASNGEIFEQTCNSKSSRLNIHGTLNCLAGRGHHRRKLSPLEDGAGIEMVPQAAFDEGKQLVRSFCNRTETRTPSSNRHHSVESVPITVFCCYSFTNTPFWNNDRQKHRVFPLFHNSSIN